MEPHGHSGQPERIGHGVGFRYETWDSGTERASVVAKPFVNHLRASIPSQTRGPALTQIASARHVPWAGAIALLARATLFPFGILAFLITTRADLVPLRAMCPGGSFY
jgi:hypothetical protein